MSDAAPSSGPGWIAQARQRPVLAVLLAAFVLAFLIPGSHRGYMLLGLATGGAYALIAVGYTMVYGIIELINFAHGEIYMFGVYLTLTFCFAGVEAFPNPGWMATGLAFLAGFFALVGGAFAHDQLTRRRASPGVTWAGAAAGAVAMGGATHLLAYAAVPTWLAVPLALGWAALLGVVVEVVAYRPLRRAPRLAALITAIGVSLILQNLAQWIWTASPPTVSSSLIPAWLQVHPPTFQAIEAAGFESADQLLASLSIWEGMQQFGMTRLFGVRFTSSQLFLLVVTSALMAGLTFLIHRTRLGKAMRACAQDRDAAYLMGVDVDRVISWTFAIGSCLGAVAGVLIAMYEFKVFPQMGYKAGLIAFAAAVLGGIGNIPGAMLGGLVLGISQQMSVWLEISEWDIGIAYGVMIAIILVQPEGLLGTQTPRKS